MIRALVRAWIRVQFEIVLEQGSAPNGPPRYFTRPATIFSYFNDRYAVINRRNDSHLIFWSSPSIRPKKGLNFWRNLFCFVFSAFANDLFKKRSEFLAKTFLFWSAGMVAVCWNLVRAECGPLAQKVADPCFKVSI